MVCARLQAQGLAGGTAIRACTQLKGKEKRAMGEKEREGSTKGKGGLYNLFILSFRGLREEIPIIKNCGLILIRGKNTL